MILLKSIARAGATFFVVGALLALAAPPLAALLGAGLIGETAMAAAASTPVLWTAAFFGAFGAINAAIEPLAQKIFQEKQAAETPHKTRLVIALAPQQAQEVNPRFREALSVERAEPASRAL